MNDFTKEELMMLKRLTLQHVNQFRENSDCIELMSKIQSMIENYCYHEHASSHLGDTVLVCNKCETILSHWNLRKAKFNENK